MVRRMSDRYWNRASIVAPVAYVGLFFCVPILSLLILAGGTQTYIDVLSRSHNWKILLNTFELSFLVTLFTLVIGYPVAIQARTAGTFWRFFLLLSTTIPLWTSLLARSYSWITILERKGLLNIVLMELGIIEQPVRILGTGIGSVLGSVYVFLPLMVLTLYAQLSAIDLTLFRASRTLGATPIKGFLRILLPLTVPGIIAGCLLVFIISLGLFVTPALLGGRGDQTLSTLIAQQVERFSNFSQAAALALLLLVATLIILGILVRLTGFGKHKPMNRVRCPYKYGWTRTIEPVLKRLTWLTRIIESPRLWKCYVGVVVLFLFGPLLTLMVMSLSGTEYLQFPPKDISLKWYIALANDSKWWSAGLSSLYVAGLTSIFVVVIGLLASLGLRRCQGVLQKALFILYLSPALIPHMVYSLGAYYTGVQVGLSDTVIGLALAHSIITLPFVIVIYYTGLQEIGDQIENAARTLGAGWIQRLRRIVIPLLSRSIIVGGLIAFLVSFDEIVVALLFTGLETRTLPKVLWQAAILEVTPIVPAASTVVLVITSMLAVVIFIMTYVYKPIRR